ncbi:MAG: DUF6402 family protein [Candidatus Accumulibacter sp.]|jgi:hypothetical protein|nr:DUF6402 family protein [Accumulibacter sp.]
MNSPETPTPPLATSTTKPLPGPSGKEVPVDVFHIDDIPGAMDKMGWKVSAQLMRRWFSNAPAYIMPGEVRDGLDAKKDAIDYRLLPPSQIDDQSVTWEWLLKFPRIQQVLNELYQTWNSPAGVDLLKRRLTKAVWKKGGFVQLGHGLTKAVDLDLTCQVNYREFGHLTDTFDDLFGAIFKATLKVAVIGTAYYDPERDLDIFEVKRMGFYIRDTYDFNAKWYDDEMMGLGVWSKDRVLSKAETADFRATFTVHGHILRYFLYKGFVPVKNSDFRRWQGKHNTGGDFYVFSDVYWVVPNVKEILLP